MTPHLYPNAFVFTGPPCSGKSTTIDLVARQNAWALFEESARQICEQAHQKKRPSPRISEDSFSQKIFNKQLQREQHIVPTKVYLLDRGVIDCLGYARVTRGTLSGLDNVRLKQRYRLVFAFDALPFHFDDSRNTFDVENREKIAACLLDTYREYGHEIIHVPVAPLEQRAAQVSTAIRKALFLHTSSATAGGHISP